MRRPPVAADRYRDRILLGALAALLVATGCTRGGQVAPDREGGSGGPAVVRNLDSIATLQDQFNRDTGRVRLILLISPT